MKKFILFIAVVVLQGCATSFLVNEAANAYRYEAIVQLPKEDTLGKRAYLGGQIVTIDRNKGQIEFVQRTINSSGYPEQGTNNLNARIFATFIPEAQFNFNNIIVGDRVAVLGEIIDIQTTKIADNEMTIIQIKGVDYRTWTNRNMRRWDDDPWAWNSFYYPRGFYHGGGFYHYR